MRNSRFFLPMLTRYKHLLKPENVMPSMIVFWSPTSKVTPDIMQTVAIIIAVVLILLFIVARLRKLKSDPPLMMALDDEAFINIVLEHAVNQKVRFDLICTRPGLEHRHLQGYCHIDSCISQVSGSCRKDDAPNIIIQLNAESVATGWDTAPVEVYFQISLNKICTLYHFASFVCSIHQTNGGTTMEIIRPSILSDSKAKDTVRIEPKEETIALSSIWFYHTEETILPQSIASLGQAQAAFRPTGNSDFRIISISASGIRLRFLRDTLDEMEHALKRGHQMCMLLAINTEQERTGKILLWLKGICKGFIPCTDNECLDAIFSFTHWQQIRDRRENIQWYPATDTDRVPPLMHWIMHAEEHDEENAQCKN